MPRDFIEELQTGIKSDFNEKELTCEYSEKHNM